MLFDFPTKMRSRGKEKKKNGPGKFYSNVSHHEEQLTKLIDKCYFFLLNLGFYQVNKTAVAMGKKKKKKTNQLWTVL